MARSMHKRVPERIRKVMRRRGVSQTALGEGVGKTQSQVSKWLRAEVPMTLEQVDQVAEVLDIPVELLLMDEED